jgi:hypothetical protein
VLANVERAQGKADGTGKSSENSQKIQNPLLELLRMYCNQASGKGTQQKRQQRRQKQSIGSVDQSHHLQYQQILVSVICLKIA